MARFLIEVPHESEQVSCVKAVKVLQSTGSHFLTHADWGCLDGEHKAWIIAQVDDKDEARYILPPMFRDQAKITQLNCFAVEKIDEFLYHHQP